MKLKNFPPIQQANPNMCFPTNLKIILDGLRIAHSNDYLKLGIHTLSKLSGFRNSNGVGDLDFAINNINSKFLNKHGYILIEISGAYKGDSTKFVSLVANTHNAGFKIEEVSADKAYSSKENLAFVNAIDGTAYIPFKSNSNPKAVHSNRLWRKMYDYFVFNREDFLEHYHKRSNVESTFNMLKTTFTDYIRSKNETAQINELLLKVLCHNICVLIQEMFELGIEPNFI